MQKKLLLTAVLFLSCCFSFYSCSKIADQLAQAISWNGVDVTFDVPPTSSTSYASIGSASFTYDLDSFIKAYTSNALSLKNLTKFTFKSCKLTILNPDTANNFANFEKAKAEFSTSANSTTAVLGEVTNNPNTYAETLDIPINNTSNMVSYLPSSGPVTINYNISGLLRTPVTTTLHVQAHIEYDIEVKP